MIKEGDLVLLHNPKVPLGHSPKLHQKFVGPYYVTAAHENFTYTIRDCKTQRQHPSRVHANRLKLFRSPADRLYNSYDPVQLNVDAPNSAEIAGAVQNGTGTTNDQNTTGRTIPAQIDDRPWHPAEKLLATRVSNKIRQYKVKWCSADPPSWINMNDVSPALIREFHVKRTQNGRRRRRRRAN